MQSFNIFRIDSYCLSKEYVGSLHVVAVEVAKPDIAE